MFTLQHTQLSLYVQSKASQSTAY